MYSNIGKKIMVFSKIVAWLGIILSVLCGLAVIMGGSIDFISGSESMPLSKGTSVFVGIAVILLGSLGSWISSWMMYGFGQLIEDMHKVAGSK